jgi:hypothetical protein
MTKHFSAILAPLITSRNSPCEKIDPPPDHPEDRFFVLIAFLQCGIRFITSEIIVVAKNENYGHRLSKYQVYTIVDIY